MPEVTVRVVPHGPDLALQAGEPLMAGAQRLGYRWPTICGGLGECTACQVRVVSGQEVVSLETAAETERLRGLRLRFETAGEALRLACQMRVHGDVVVEKRGVRPLSRK